MKVLVCGSEGSLSQAVITNLLNNGHIIRGIDNFFRYGEISRKREYEFIKGDLCDLDTAIKATKGVDYVIQGAARIFGAGGFRKYPADILSYDVTLHQNVLWGALKNKVNKVVYTSSSMVYERATKVPSEENDVDDMPIPLTDYGLSKLVGERLSKAFHNQYGLTYIIWRPFNIITPYEEADAEPGIAHVFADFIKKIVLDQQNPMEIFGDGEQIRCFTWIGDVASAISEHSFEPSTDCEVFNLGNPEPVTMKELAKRIYHFARNGGFIKISDELNFTSIPGFQDDVKIRIPSIEKARKVLHWEPKIKLNESLELCIRKAAELSRQRKRR
jgi:UDP-glucose 4-epimerase